MTNQKPTPGPWRIRENTSAIIPEVSILNDRGYKVAGVGTIRDARLIAAAPDLLAACQSLVDLWAEWAHNADSLREPVRRSIGMRVEEAAAAILKTKGDE